MRILFIRRANGYLYCRLAYQNLRSVPFSIGLPALKVSQWDAKKQKIKNDKAATDRLRHIKNELLSLHYKNPSLSPEQLKNIFLGKVPKAPIDYLKKFCELEEDKKNSGQISAATFKNFLNHLKLFENFCKSLKINYLDFKSLHVEDFYRFLKEAGYQGGYIKIVFVAIRRLFNYLDSHEVIEKHPFRKYRQPSFVRAKHLLSDEDIEKIFAVKDNPFALLFQIQIVTGMAYADTQKFEEAKILEKNGNYYLKYRRQKTRRLDKFCFSPLTVEAVELLKNGVPTIKYNTYKNNLKVLFDELGILSPPRTHSGRKAYGNLLLKKGYNPKEVSFYMGHTDLSMTDEHYLGEVLLKKAS